MQKNPILLLILDGFGHSDNHQDNAISMANTPHWDYLLQNYPHTLINASELHVGLPKGQMGNSEVGHLNIGAGRVINQDIERINSSIENNEFFRTVALINNFKQLAENNKALHIFGLLSDGGVHSHINHFTAMIKFAKQQKVKKVFIHAFLDGRDTPPKSAEKFITQIEIFCKKIKLGEIASVCGRFYAMDRDNRWERIKPAFDLVMFARSNINASSAQSALKNGYARGETDEFILPTSINTQESNKIISDNDTIIFMNFRSDRSRQLTNAILDDKFDQFNRGNMPKQIQYFSLTSYDESQTKAQVIFKPIKIKNTLGQCISDSGKTQLRIAETEKYPHITFFFNGGDENTYPGESRILVPSPKVTTYDLQPEMSAYEITKRLNDAISSLKYDVIICNYANGDMVGHTGNINAAIKAVEVLDECMGSIYNTIKEVGGHLLITADHGNVEQMKDIINNQLHTQHTTNQVPFVYIGQKAKIKSSGKLSDIAPTILNIMNQTPPQEMTGTNLIQFDE
ncbi:MAG: 2,3-bisphosphoglycerate-independent phosphoglycerate mutase [Methylophilaceae bacterium]